MSAPDPTGHADVARVGEDDSTNDGASTPAERAAEAALAVPGVADLHAGSFGEVGTYLPGRRVTGIRIRDDLTEVHVVAAMGSPLRELADAVRSAVAPIVGTPVQVVVEDVVPARTTARTTER